MTHPILDTLRRHTRHQRGYSIVEIITAMAVATTLSAIAVPNLMEFSARYQLASAAHQVAFDVARARLKAIGENVYCRVVFATNSPGSRYWLERSNDGTTYTTDGAVTRLPSSVSFSSLPSIVPTFNRLGLGTGTTVISLANTKGQAKTVNVSPLGKVAIQ